MTGGEAAAAVMLDAVVRLIPGVLGNIESAMSDSHVEDLLGPPVYTRPEEFMGLKVPQPLVDGNHKLIEQFRRKESIRKTYTNRPELLDRFELDEQEKEYLEQLRKGKKDKRG